MSKAKMQHCWVCRAELGVYERMQGDYPDDCGSSECQRESINAERAERDAAHEQLDRERGWKW